MGAVAFDTHEFIKTLEKGGLTESQAEAISAAVRNSHEAAELATKTDLRELEGHLDIKHEALRHEISDVRHEMDAKHEALRHEIGDVRKDMDAKHEALRKDRVAMEQRMDVKHEALRHEVGNLRHEMKALGLRLTIWLGGIVFVAVNAGPIISKLLHLF